MIVRFLILLCVVTGCAGRSSLGEADLYKYVRNPDNDLVKTIELEGFKLVMILKPVSMIAKQQMETDKQTEYDSLVERFSKHLYFTLEITYNGKNIETMFGATPDFNRKLVYLNSELATVIKVNCSGTPAKVLDCIYFRSFGMGPSNCMLVIEKPDADRFEVEINDTVLGFGKQIFTFSNSDIKNIPPLKNTFL